MATITYTSYTKNFGTTSPPTAAEAAFLPVQTAQVFWADSDVTAAVVVHNWGLPASFPSFLFPEVWMVKSLGGGSDSSFATNFTFGLTNTNSVSITKIGNGTGQGGTYNVYLRKPYTPVG